MSLHFYGPTLQPARYMFYILIDGRFNLSVIYFDLLLLFDMGCESQCYSVSCVCNLVQVTKYRRLLIGRDVHLDQSEAYDIS